MKFIIDEMPIYRDFCPFYRVALWVNDCTKRKHACVLSKECCDLTEKGCEWLNPIEAEEERMDQCEICEEMGYRDCENCYLGNPCIDCADYDKQTHTCTSNGACGGEAEEEES